MLWKRDEPDPLQARRRQLEEQQRQLIEQRRKLTEQLQQPAGSAPKDKRNEPPVWRMEDDIRNRPSLDTAPPRKRNLGRQRQSDMILFFVLITLLLVLVVVVWIAYLHTTAAATGH